MTPEKAKAIRLVLGMTQDDMKEYLNLKYKSQVSHLESGRTGIAGPVLRLLELLEASGGNIFRKTAN